MNKQMLLSMDELTHPLGVVYMDFPGEKLVGAIIDMNDFMS
jgi:hypothetical protein